MKKKIVLILFSIGLYSCKPNEIAENNSNILELNIESYENELMDFIESIKIRPIKDPANLINGYPEKIVKIDSGFALVDFQVNHEIYLLADDFNISSKIASQGEGPEEYSRIYDIVYNPKRKLFTIMDLNKMVEFGFNGDFKRAVPFTYFPDRLDVFNNTYIIWNNNRPLENNYFRYYRLSEDYEIVEEQIPFNSYEDNFSREPAESVFTKDDHIYFTSWMNDTIYSLTKESSKVSKTILKFENSPVNSTLSNKFNFEEEIEKEALNKDIWLWEFPTITDDYFLSLVFRSGNPRFLIQQNKTGKGYLSSTHLTINDAFLLMAMQAKNIVEENTIYYLAEAEMVEEFLMICFEKDDLICSMLKSNNSEDHTVNYQFYFVEINLKDENNF